MDYIYIDRDLNMSQSDILDYFASKNGYLVVRESVGSIYLVKSLDDYIRIIHSDEYKSMWRKKSLKFVFNILFKLAFKSLKFMLFLMILLYMKKNCVVKNNQFICSFK